MRFPNGGWTMGSFPRSLRALVSPFHISLLLKGREIKEEKVRESWDQGSSGFWGDGLGNVTMHLPLILATAKNEVEEICWGMRAVRLSRLCCAGKPCGCPSLIPGSAQEARETTRSSLSSQKSFLLTDLQLQSSLHRERGVAGEHCDLGLKVAFLGTPMGC